MKLNTELSPPPQAAVANKNAPTLKPVNGSASQAHLNGAPMKASISSQQYAH